MAAKVWAIGVDLGGTKVEVASVDSGGLLHHRLRRPTNVKAGPAVIQGRHRCRRPRPVGEGRISACGRGCGCGGSN